MLCIKYHFMLFINASEMIKWIEMKSAYNNNKWPNRGKAENNEKKLSKIYQKNEWILWTSLKDFLGGFWAHFISPKIFMADFYKFFRILILNESIKIN